MKFHILAIRDSAADVYTVPQFVPSIGGFVRSFGDQVAKKEPGDSLGAHPEDFEVFHIGEYDDSNAQFDIFSVPKSVCRGADYVSK